MTAKTIIITTVPNSRAGVLGKIGVRRTAATGGNMSSSTHGLPRISSQKALAPSRVIINRAPTIPISTRSPVPTSMPLSASSNKISLQPHGLKRVAASPTELEVKDEPVFIISPPRKRERLTHLTPEEKQNRRKMKNRIAAQTARDRKKAKMGDLEENVNYLNSQNETLLAENAKLKKRTNQLSTENNKLKSQMEALEKKCEDLERALESSTRAFGSAASISAPLQKEQAKEATRWALIWTVLTMLLWRPSSGTSSKEQKLSTLRQQISNKIFSNVENTPANLLSPQLFKMVSQEHRKRRNRNLQ